MSALPAGHFRPIREIAALGDGPHPPDPTGGPGARQVPLLSGWLPQSRHCDP